MNDITLALADEAATLALGGRLAQAITPGMTIWLRGDLGAGKTTLVRGVLHGLGYAGKVKSPTYTLVEPYVVSGLYLYHFDLYRFNDPEEWDASGFREHFNPSSVCFVEWPDKAGNLIPEPDLKIDLALQGAGRSAVIVAGSPQGKACLDKLSSV